jgi:23S rRNA pseudouridine2604 synthase
MSEPIRLAKRVVELLACSRQEAEQYIQGGWVLVNGEVVDEPQFKVLDQDVQLDANATLAATQPATLLLHKPAGMASDAAVATLMTPANRWAEDASGVRRLRRHFVRLTAVMSLEAAASGLLVLTQDPRLLRRLREDATRLEQEFNVEVSGEIAPYGLRRLAHGLSYQGRTLPPGKVSWQNETRLRFALKDVREGQLAAACADVDLTALAIKRLRIGRVPLAKMPVGQWRYLADSERL